MPDYVPKVVFYAALGIIVVLILWAASEYLDDAIGLLPGREGAGG
jgi:hypothetical protein